MRFFMSSAFVLTFTLLAGCGGGGEPAAAPPAATPPATFTLVTTGFGNLTGLTYNAGLSSSSAIAGGAVYTITYSNTTNDSVILTYTNAAAASEDTISIRTIAGGELWAGTPPSNVTCHYSGTNHFNYSLCSAWGITVNRITGTFTMIGTPMLVLSSQTAANGTMSGAFTFPQF
jgi:hypothetical protein